MKTFLSLAFCLILAAPAAAKREPVIVGRFQPDTTTNASGKFGVGAERRSVVEIIGLPSHRMGDTLWIYYDFTVVADAPRTGDLDALVIVFKHNRVAALRLTDSAVLRDLIARQKLKVTGPSYADLLR
jgi:hypothetical protein